MSGAGPALPSVVHVPMAFTGTGNTLLSVVRQLGAAYADLGGRSVAVLSANRDVTSDPVPSLAVDYTQRAPRTWYNRRELATDVVAGRAGVTRPYYGRLYDPAVRAVEELDVDAVLLYEGHYASATLPRWARVRDRARICLYVHNPLSRSYGRRELRRLLGSADAVVFCADHLRRDVEERAGERVSDLFTVHNGLDPRYRVQGPRAAPPEGDEAVVLFVGKMSPAKGVHLVLDAADRAARATGRRVRVRAVGSTEYGSARLSPYEEQLREQARTLSIPVDFVRSLDVEGLRAQFAAATLACLPSTWAEGLPLVALEAMASALPVVCSRSPGMVEACADAAVMAPMDDVDGLVDGIASLLTDASEWARRSAASWQRASGFSWSTAASRIGGILGAGRVTV